MDLQAVARIQASREQLDQRRHQQAEKHVAKAFAVLNQAFDPAFAARKRELLTQACDAFAEALQQHRQNPEVYIGLGYLSIVLHDYAQARNYLNEGQRLAPEHPDFAQMLQYLDQRLATPAAAPQEAAGLQKIVLPAISEQPLPPAAALSDADYDRLYDQAEAQILQILQELPQIQLPLYPSLELHQDKALQAVYRQLQGRYEGLQTRLAVLDEELDIATLRQRLHMLEVFLKRCQTLFEAATEIQQVQQALLQLQQEVLGLQAQVGRVTMPVSQIDALLDRCDYLADRLDAFEGKKYAVAPLISSYERVVQHIEQLQEALEEQT